MPLKCPHCQKVNPDAAAFCFNDGANLKGGGGVDANRLASVFGFPSGRSCNTFDELVAGCQEEWVPARDMLRQGVFKQYFASSGRMDLVKACDDAAAQGDPDTGLALLLDALPASTRAQGPKIDINPRRIQLGKVRAGETRKIPFRVMNVGKGVLQGTVSITEGSEWLRLGSGDGQVALKTTREQQLPLTADTRGLAAGEPYAAKLRIITNGGAQEVPIRMDLAAHAFPRAPFQGARTPRQMAVKMRDNPKGAAALLGSGELPKWFDSNGWTYPISGTPAPGVAGVQQFFESMGLAKPPGLKLSHPQLDLVCKVPERAKAQVKLFATSKKYVYANVSSDAPWLNVLTPSVSGPQQAGVLLEVDPRQLPRAKSAETNVTFLANGNQKLRLKVRVAIERAADTPIRRVMQGIIVMGLAFFLLRLFAAPFVDFYARSAAVNHGAKQIEDKFPQDHAARDFGYGWLSLPWSGILLGIGPMTFPEGIELDVYNENKQVSEEAKRNVGRFRDAFVSSFVRIVVLLTWWIGPLVAGFLLLRRSGFFNSLWGILSGVVLGVVVSASLACLILLLDLVVGFPWYFVFGGRESNIVFWLIWVVLSVGCWTIMGAALGMVLKIFGPLGRVMHPIQEALSGLFRICGIRGLANFFAVQ